MVNITCGGVSRKVRASVRDGHKLGKTAILGAGALNLVQLVAN